MKEITLKIPTKPEFKRWWEIIKFKVRGGFVCEGCGSKTFFDQVEISHTYKDKGFLFGTHNWGENYCTSCVQQEIDDNATHIFIEHKNCDWCESGTPTVHFYNYHPTDDVRVKFTFGMNSWNSANICQPCMHWALEEGKGHESSSMYKMTKGGNSKPYNRLGLTQK